MSILTLTAEQYAAHQRRVTDARLIIGSASARITQEDIKPVQATQPAKPKPEPRKSAVIKESEVLRACMDVLEVHPVVKLWWRQNTGAQKIGNRFVKFGFRGASDLMGVLEGGRFLAVEAKAPGRKPTLEQAGFLDNVTAAGGLALCVSSSDRLADALDHARFSVEPAPTL